MTQPEETATTLSRKRSMKAGGGKRNITQMQEKLDGLKQKQLQEDIGKGRNTLNKSRLNKIDHINMEIVLEFCKNKMFPINKFLELSLLIFSSSNEQCLCVELSRLIEKPRELITPNDHGSIGQTASCP